MFLCGVLMPAASIQTRESKNIADTCDLLYVPYANCDLINNPSSSGLGWPLGVDEFNDLHRRIIFRICTKEYFKYSIFVM